MKCEKICLMKKEIDEKKYYLETLLQDGLLNNTIIKKSQELDTLIVECLKCEISSNKVFLENNKNSDLGLNCEINSVRLNIAR